MAQVKVNGNAQPFQAFGREIAAKNFSLGVAMTQADLDALVEAVQAQNVTVSMIGAFDAGVSTSVNMIVDGHGDIVVAGYTIADVAL